MSISCEGDKVITFCCAMGQFRGPKYNGLVPGSKFEELGYFGLAEWLEKYPKGQRETQLRLFYDNSFFILIVDDADMLRADTREVLLFVCTLLCCANIPYAIIKSQDLNDKIKSEKNFVFD